MTPVVAVGDVLARSGVGLALDARLEGLGGSGVLGAIVAHTDHSDHGTDVVAHADLGIFLLIGLLAGAHCLGMCGPLVTAYGDRMSAGKSTRRRDDLTLFEVRQHLLFNLGRTASYALLGAFFALLGALAFASLDATVAMGDRVRGVTGILVGVAIIASGLYYVRGRAGIPGHDLPLVGRAFVAVTGVLSARIDRLAAGPGIALLGGVHGLLPCPIIYPAYLYAFALAEPIRGAAVLAVLGLGTIPTLFLYGTLVSGMGTKNRVRLHRVLGVAFLVLGYVPLQHGLMLYGIHLPHPPIPFYQPL